MLGNQFSIYITAKADCDAERRLAYRYSKNQEKCVPVMVTKDFFVCVYVCLKILKHRCWLQ